MAENRNTIGISTLLHHGLAFTDPKMKPTYPWSRKAEGMPTIVMMCTALRSNAIASGETFVEPSERIQYMSFFSPRLLCFQRTMSARYSNQISKSSTDIRYHR